MKSINWMKGLALVAGMIALPAFANLELEVVAQQEQKTTDAAGNETTELVEATMVVPGSEVIYTIHYRNTGEDVVNRAVIKDPIPASTTYVEGSAFGAGTEITFSADGGQTWGTPEELTVLGEDGNPRAAEAADYTHVRWVVSNEVPPGGRGFVRFRARVQ